ncbi:ABC transporter permease [Bacteroides caecigallinarum]|uniref:ABC transporter permease n=1 Tax=Bacteroides caecigallinarum TaxID=1411144 RepID=UPI00195D4CD9|nr:ABC transporter permease [Bacteroides caecigallinarum]MBM6865756.1 ABC transporter permease [Bacteroides caecigallinarum]MBU3808087.1 ABC transporter permease [Candidatus Phocaeicola faecipullorum]
MNWKLFIARRIYKNNDGNKEVSKPAVRIAMAGISIGLAVMIVSVAVVIGFKNQVRDKVVGLASEVIVTSLDDAQLYMTAPVAAGDSLLDAITKKPYVSHVQRYSVKPGMIMTSDNFQGMVLKGVGKEYDLTYISQHVIDGEIPLFTDTAATNKVMLSKSMADKLKLKAGDKIYTYYVDDNVRARRLTVSAIYQTNFSAFDDYFLITDIYTVNRLNKWEPDQVSGVEIDVDDYSRIDEVNDNLRSSLFESSDKYGQSYFSRTIVEANPQIFAWLDLLDLNVWVILILMTGVAGFTMISGLLIIILERTNMIGVLKAMGADNNSIRKIFLSFSVFLIGRGMLWGNIIGLSLCLIQYFFEPVKLDPSVYYVNSVPIELNVFIYILLNVFTLVVSVLMLVGPSYLISRIHPARSIRYE